MRVLTAVIAIASGVLVLLGIFLEEIELLNLIRAYLTDWAVIIAGMAVLIGVFNLFFVHMEKVQSRKKGSLYSALLIVSLLGTALYGSIVGLDENPVVDFAVDAVIIPVEASLLAILAVTLVYASIRLLRRRTDLMSVIFLVTVLFLLLAVMPSPFALNPYVQFAQEGVLRFTGMISQGGARGLLIGVALGTLLTGLRVLFGIDRPYGGN